MTNRAKQSDSVNNSYQILIIDDNTQIHEDFIKVLRSKPKDRSLDDLDQRLFDIAAPKTSDTDPLPNFELDFATQGKAGYEKVCKAVEYGTPYALAFVDVRMPPGWDGIETISKILEVDSKIQAVICTAYSDYSIDDILTTLGLSDRVVILRKPFDPVELQSLTVALTQKWTRELEFSRMGRTQSMNLERAASLLNITTKENENLVQENQDHQANAKRLNQALEDSYSQINAAKNALMVAITSVVESRDASIGDQLKRIQSIAQIIAERLQKFGAYKDLIDNDFLREFARSTPLYDIGKIGIPDGILLKAGALSNIEFEIMKQHTMVGCQIIRNVSECFPDKDTMEMAELIARHHHESWDGSGYPDGLKGDAIPLPARIVAVADAFDAMTSQRLYRVTKTDFEARCEIEATIGTRFDPEVVNAFGAVFTEVCEAKRLFAKNQEPGLVEQG